MLSMDEMGEIAKFSSRKNFKLLEEVENFHQLDCQRCKSTEEEFETVTGIELEIFIAKIRHHKKDLKGTIDIHLETLSDQYSKELIVEKPVYDYFYRLFEFQFEYLIYNTGIFLLLEEYIRTFDSEKISITLRGIEKFLGNKTLHQKMLTSFEKQVGIDVETWWFTLPSELGDNPVPTFTQ